MGVSCGGTSHWKQELMNKLQDMDTDNYKAVLVDLSDLTGGSFVKAVTGATNATPIVVTATSHGWTNSDRVCIGQVGGNTNANGVFQIANQATNTFELQQYDENQTLVDVAGNSAYTSGGYVVNITTIQDLADITAGARVATSGNLTSATIANGVWDFADFTWSSVTGDQSHAVFFYHDTPAAEANKTIVAVDMGASNLPVTPNGGDINYNVNASGLIAL